MRILIKNGIVVNEGVSQKADIVVEDDKIKDIVKEGVTVGDGDSFDYIIDATDSYVLPGIIDAHVHFREPGLTHKADMETESRAAIYGGVTSVFEMPNTKPQTTTLEALKEKENIARGKMHTNYAFFPGATNDNLSELKQLDVHSVPGIKLFMGSSTGNMLVDKEEALNGIFALAKEMELPLMAHCEDTEIINENMAAIKKQLGTDDPQVDYHPLIRSEEACCKSSALAAELARKHDTRLHIAHITTEKELSLLGGKVTGEVTPAHLVFSVCDYEKKGALIKCNPAVKSINDQLALRKAFLASTLYNHMFKDVKALDNATIGTDHAPHTFEEKQGGCAKAMSGMPSIQFSLAMLLGLIDEGETTIEQLVSLMCHNPARMFAVDKRGFIRKGYKADITIVKRSEKSWTPTKECIQSKCGWSPFEGMEMKWEVRQTMVNGHLIYNNGVFDKEVFGEHLTFRNKD